MNTCLVYFVLTYVQKIDEERRSRGQFRLLDRFSCNINFVTANDHNAEK